MKKKQNVSIFPLLIMGLFLAFSNSCKKDDDNNPTNGRTTALFNSGVTYGTTTDQDGNVYKTVTIGTQTWMAENLRTTKYNDGTSIPLVTNDDKWSNLSTGAYCNCNNTTNSDTIATYGRFYNWHAVNTGKLAPKGWHLPTDAEWIELIDYLGGLSDAGGKLKEIGATHWNNPNEGATNETGFTALPVGYRTNDGRFFNFGFQGCWWIAAEYLSGYPLCRLVTYQHSGVGRSAMIKEMGVSVRCVRD